MWQYAPRPRVASKERKKNWKWKLKEEIAAIALQLYNTQDVEAFPFICILREPLSPGMSCKNFLAVPVRRDPRKRE